MPRLLNKYERKIRYPLAPDDYHVAISSTGRITFPTRTAEEALAIAARYETEPFVAWWDEAEAAPAHPDCKACQDREDPTSHNGSIRCRSGSIASGGNRAHCTCDTCF